MRAALLCALALVALPGVASAATPGPGFYGVNVEPLIKLGLVPQSEWNGYIATMAADGMTVARSDAEWDWVEPNAPATPGDETSSSWDWNNTTTTTGLTYPVPESMDELVTLLAENHVRFLPVLDSAPKWAGDLSTGVQLEPQYYVDYANYAGAFAARYGPGGTFWAENPQLPYLPVEQYEIWTEANSAYFWAGPNGNCGGFASTVTWTPDPTVIATCASEYASGLTLASAAIHAAVQANDPGATVSVLASIGWQNPGLYVPDLIGDVPAGTIDGIAFHPYGCDAPAILGLDQGLRSTLDSLGAPYSTMPIYDTEDSQPAVPASQAAQYSCQGYVTDAARAAMVSLASYALAHSDCGVQDYLYYGLVGSGNPNLEPNDEGLMGMYSLTGDLPNLTGTALIDAAYGWSQDPSTGIVLCGTGTTPSADLLPLGLTVTPTSAGCVSATVTYWGNPLEGADLELEAGDLTVETDRQGPEWYLASDANGSASLCLGSDPPPVTTFTVVALIDNVAVSGTATCPITGGACTQAPAPPAPPTPPPPPAPTPASSSGSGSSTASSLSSTSPTGVTNTYVLKGRIVKIGKHGTKLSAQLLLNDGAAARAGLTVSIKAKGKHAKAKVVAHKTLPSGKPLVFTIRERLVKGEKVVLSVAAYATLDRPALSKTLTAG